MLPATMHLQKTSINFLWTVLSFLVLSNAIGETSGLAIRAECNEDYSPCTCTQEGVDVYVTCVGIPPADVKTMFASTTYPVLKEIELYLPPVDNGNIVPADVLSRKVAERIIIHGHSREDFPLEIDFGAFTPSKNKTNLFQISDANLNMLNFGFLDGFVKLEHFNLTRSSGVRVIKDIKLLPSLDSMYINDCLGFTEFTEFPTGNFPVLRILHLTNNKDLSDDKLSIILTALYASSARETLYELFIDANNLIRMPLRLPEFPALERVSMRLNAIGYLQVNSVGSVKSAYFNIQNNQLQNIEPDAFAGDFSEAEILLDFNNLTYFYEPVYKPILQSMFDAGELGGKLSVNSNPINCDCTIAWLVARNPALLQNIDNQARCVSGQLFTQLDENAYALCP